jgi:hypothetical protein
MRRLTFALPLVFLATEAHAVPAPPTIDSLWTDQPTALEVDALDVTIDCVAEGDYRLGCKVSATYTIVNPTEQPVTAELHLPAWATDAITVDGSAVDVDYGERYRLTAAPGATHTIVTRHDVHIWPHRGSMFLVFEPLVVRHAKFGDHSGPGYVPSLGLPSASERSWARAGRATYTARYPSSWSTLVGWTHADEPGTRVATRTGDAGTEMWFGPYKPTKTWQFLNGGPYAEIGGTFGVGVRGRIGYEVGVRPWLLGSMSLGTDFDEELTITPVIEAATPSAMVLPSLGLGVGAPIRVRPDSAVGLRIQLVATWPVGFITTFDYWPDDDVWRTTMSARIGI